MHLYSIKALDDDGNSMPDPDQPAQPRWELELPPDVGSDEEHAFNMQRFYASVAATPPPAESYHPEPLQPDVVTTMPSLMELELAAPGTPSLPHSIGSNSPSMSEDDEPAVIDLDAGASTSCKCNNKCNELFKGPADVQKLAEFRLNMNLKSSKDRSCFLFMAIRDQCRDPSTGVVQKRTDWSLLGRKVCFAFWADSMGVSKNRATEMKSQIANGFTCPQERMTSRMPRLKADAQMDRGMRVFSITLYSYDHSMTRHMDIDH